MKKEAMGTKLQIWVEARKRYHLTDAQIQMARELGLNPKKFGSLANERQETWKRPLGEFIEHSYLKHFGKAQPDRVLSLEQQAQEKRERKRIQRDMAKNLGKDKPHDPSGGKVDAAG
jgi:hypothetical protein